ncbi:unnamed protein product [Rangifer tarandus platyrhynchus]|uniref:Uncharacterized protein n=1 Tax=Rangifer tarandus platyrhynchus TaxID=3082113 RepID=A0AC59YXD2_RANTA
MSCPARIPCANEPDPSPCPGPHPTARAHGCLRPDGEARRADPTRRKGLRRGAPGRQGPRGRTPSRKPPQVQSIDTAPRGEGAPSFSHARRPAAPARAPAWPPTPLLAAAPPGPFHSGGRQRVLQERPVGGRGGRRRLPRSGSGTQVAGAARNILGSTKTREGEAQAAPELRRAALSARPLPRWVSPPLPLPGNWRLRGVPRAESACLFKRPRGAPREPPGAGGGGRGRERLAPGGRGSTTKLRPLSLRIGRAPQTGGGRALSRPPPPPRPSRARASGGRGPLASGLRPPARCTRSGGSEPPATRKPGGGGLGRVWPRP